MKKTLLFLISAMWMMVSCGGKTVAPISFQSQEFTASADEKSKASFQILIAQGDETAAAAINASVFEKMKEIIFFGEKPYSSENYQQLADDFIQSYRDLKSEFPHDSFGFEALVTSKVVHQDAQCINFLIDHYTYTGGAHGYGTVTSLHYDATSGAEINAKDLFSDWDGLVAFAEAKFREENQITADASLNSAGFMFEEDAFWLSENIVFHDKGITVIYNPYDIAAYAEGQIKLELTKEEIAPFIKK